VERTGCGLFEENVCGAEEKYDIPNYITVLRIRIWKRNLQKPSKLIADVVANLEIPFW